MPDRTKRFMLPAMCALALALNLWGIRRDLPYEEERDETFFVVPAYGMAVTSKWDPHWFGHPGSTVIYPLRLLYSAWIAVVHQGEDFSLASASSTQIAFEKYRVEYFYLGRILSIAYLVAAVPVLFLMLRQIFDERVAFWGSLLWIANPLLVQHAQITRTDSACIFFGYLALMFLKHIDEHPVLRNRLWAAAMMACAVSSHYKMICLGPLWLWVEWRIWRRSRLDVRAQAKQCVSSLLFGILIFLILNPFLLVHMRELRQNMTEQLPVQHVGADGFSPMGNLAWYIFTAVPDALGWLTYLLATAGFFIVLKRGNSGQKVLPGFIGLYLFAIIWSPLHWSRWLVVIVPALSFLAIEGFFQLISKLPQRGRSLATIAGLLAILLPTIILTGLENTRNASLNTRIQALRWVQLNTPARSKIAYEWYTVPLKRQPYDAVEIYSLAASGHSLASYQAAGYQYLIVGSSMYDRYLDDPGRYPSESDFYRQLFSTQKLEARFLPSLTVGGSEIKIYSLSPSSRH